MAGEGIKISLDDANADSPDVTSFMIVHDTTLISIVDGLRASGAQAISINDERIVSSTDIVCVGPSISVNGKKVFSPFTIKAIGDAESLYSAFIESNAYKSISLSDLKIDVEKKSNVIIPKYAGMYE